MCLIISDRPHDFNYSHPNSCKSKINGYKNQLLKCTSSKVNYPR